VASASATAAVASATPPSPPAAAGGGWGGRARVFAGFFGGKTMAHKLGTNTKVGDAFPNVAVDIGFLGLDPANKKMTGDLAKGNTLWVSLPGAFTPT